LLQHEAVLNTDSTIGIDTDEMTMVVTNQNEKIEFTILDFAGQIEYCATHQVSHFIS
jgi:GTPase SAR1 family protein